MRIVLLTAIRLSNRDIDTIPAGATGYLRRNDEYHLQLTFERHHCKLLSMMDNMLILDEHDTDPEIWNAIAPVLGQFTGGPLLGLKQGRQLCENMAPEAQTLRSIYANCT